MQCTNHAQTTAVDRCTGCAEPFCGDCLVEIRGQKYCGSCKVMAVRGEPALESVTETCEEATKALQYALIGLFCFGIILGPMAISKALRARRMIADDPRLTGIARANTAIAIGVFSIVLWGIGIVDRLTS